ncbi:MAG TPA: tannase/feruloyl esterase family alpha/beta hydrolase [Vicinamibacterales bacterium]|jgi:feruloyl esterase|nr:tannase/feruloyl esterase family alpha/beta hydrolase [Vicinamibacterales bacterium]
MISSLIVMAAAAFLQPPACAALKTLSLPNATITSAEFVATGAASTGRAGRGGSSEPLPAHCKVAATLTPSADSQIEMELWLPAEGWNGKFLAMGNGAWAGNISLDAIAVGLRRGYATASNDTGHTGGSASFAVGHPEKLVDFAYRAMHEMAVQSKTIIRAFYGRAPQLSYYQGCSTGGRQGMMEAQRYPEDFDAIIAGAPVYNMVHLNVSQVGLQVEMLKNPERLVPAEKKTMFANAVVAACDERDGVKDGIVNNPRACTFDPAVLACKEGDRADCLTGAQVESARSVWAAVKTKSGELVYPGRSPGFESGWRVPVPGTPLNPLFTDMPRFIGRQDANWDPMTFDLEKDLALALKNAGFVEANDANLAKFKARGGKLLLYHGWADPGPAPENTINYYDAVNKKLGGKQDDWMRLFLMPGVGHCGGGVGPDQADFLGALEQWREKGVAPSQINASRPAGRGVSTPMSRPLCPFPQVARYKGSGSSNDAANFSCAAP